MPRSGLTPNPPRHSWAGRCVSTLWHFLHFGSCKGSDGALNDGLMDWSEIGWCMGLNLMQPPFIFGFQDGIGDAWFTWSTSQLWKRKLVIYICMFYSFCSIVSKKAWQRLLPQVKCSQETVSQNKPCWQMLFILLGIILFSLWRVTEIAEPVRGPEDDQPAGCDCPITLLSVCGGSWFTPQQPIDQNTISNK